MKPCLTIVTKFAAGHYMTFSPAGEMKIVQYWDLKEQVIDRSAADVSSTG